jgi:hypothetical protein
MLKLAMSANGVVQNSRQPHAGFRQLLARGYERRILVSIVEAHAFGAAIVGEFL